MDNGTPFRSYYQPIDVPLLIVVEGVPLFG